MDDVKRQLLIDYLDGSLPPGQRPELEALLERDAEAAAFVAEHRLVWEALGEALDDTGVEPDAAFRQATLAAARQSRRPSLVRAASLAAALVIGVSVVVWFLQDDGPALTPEDREVVRYLHVLQHLDLVQNRGRDLDLRRDLEVLRALEDS